MSDTGRRVIVLGFVVAALILLVGMLALLGFFGVGLMPGRSNPTPIPADPSVSPKPAVAKDDLAGVVEQLGGQLFSEEPGTYFVKLTGARFEPKQLEQLQPFQNVVELSLLSTRTDDDGLKFVATLKNLRRINLESTAVTDKGMASVSKLKNLRVLRLAKTQVTGKGLAVLADMGGLEELDLSFTPIHGREFEPLHTLSGLKTLTLDESQTTYSALKVFERLPSLEDIYSFTPSGRVDLANVWCRGGLSPPQKHYWKQD